MTNVIAIDGPAASGKSTIADALSQKLRIPYISTGNMYRAVTLHTLRAGVDDSGITNEKISSLLPDIDLKYIQDPNDSTRYSLFMNGQSVDREIRAPEVAARVSKVAALPIVREWLVALQRDLVDKIGMVVMEGRDIGTVVFPDSNHKFFLTASPEIRAKRRLLQAGETLEGSTVASVAAEIAKRDEMDMNRAISPLKKAEDAVLIDSSDKTAEQIVSMIEEMVKDVEHN